MGVVALIHFYEYELWLSSASSEGRYNKRAFTMGSHLEKASEELLVSC